MLKAFVHGLGQNEEGFFFIIETQLKCYIDIIVIDHNLTIPKHNYYLYDFFISYNIIFPMFTTQKSTSAVQGCKDTHE